MKSNIFLTMLLLVVSNHAIAEKYFGLPSSLNNFSYNKEQAYIPSYEKNTTTIHFVDFKNKNHREVAKGKIGAFSVNYTKKYLAYINTYGEKITVIKTDTSEVIFTGGRADQGFSRWADNENKLTYFDARNEKLYVVTIKNKPKIISAKAKGELISTKWNNECHCFEYQFMPIEESGLSGVFRITNNKLVKIKEKKSLLVSPDKKYYVKPQAVAETGNYLTLYDLSSNKALKRYDTGELLWIKTGVVWKNNIIRMIGRPSGSINLVTGDILSSRNGDILIYDQLREYTPFLYSDLASDNKGYVLMWNRKEKAFEVEDIGTSKTIATYNKFW